YWANFNSVTEESSVVTSVNTSLPNGSLPLSKELCTLGLNGNHEDTIVLESTESAMIG
ncbi:unnamed protein product, partial [Allacma fusca]